MRSAWTVQESRDLMQKIIPTGSSQYGNRGFLFATDYSIDIAELAVELEQRGFATLLQPEHTCSASRKTEWPGVGDLRASTIIAYDPFVALSFAAA